MMQRRTVLLIIIAGLCLTFGGAALLAYKDRNMQLVQLGTLQTQLTELAARRINMNDIDGGVRIAATELWSRAESADPVSRLQDRALSIVRELGLEMRRFQQLPPRSEGELTRISVRLELSGAYVDILHLIRAGEMSTPPFTVSDLTLRTLSERDQIDGTTQVSAQVILWGYAETEE